MLALPCEGSTNNASNVNIAGEIFTKYEDFIRQIIRFRINNEELANDLLQDFFLSLVAKPPPIDTQNIKGYLYRAVTNDIVDAIRRIENYRSRIRRYAERNRDSVNKQRPENDLIMDEELNKVIQLIETHSRRSEAKAIILRHNNGYTVKEIAEKMHVSTGTIRGYISDGLKSIRHYLKIR